MKDPCARHSRQAVRCHERDYFSSRSSRAALSHYRGHVVILDSATRSEEDLGPGLAPTWSPDGRLVAFQAPGDRGSRRDGDYVLLQADPPHERALLLSNAR